MTDIEIQDFVTRFAAAWAERDGEAFLALWHPDGVLRSPLYDRPVAGKELGFDRDREATRVYADTAPLRAAATGESVKAIVALDADGHLSTA
jgi:ketosteroid isomerase-like protein